MTWNPPYTLDGVDILGYNITITSTSDGAYFTQDTQYIISCNDDGDSTELTLAISCYNGAGDGNITSFDFYCPQGWSV